MQSWLLKTSSCKDSELDLFFSTPIGVELLNCIFFAVYISIHFGSGGMDEL